MDAGLDPKMLFLFVSMCNHRSVFEAKCMQATINSLFHYSSSPRFREQLACNIVMNVILHHHSASIGGNIDTKEGVVMNKILREFAFATVANNNTVANTGVDLIVTDRWVAA